MRKTVRWWLSLRRRREERFPVWQMKFRQSNGQENRLTFGPYPEITLLEAREKSLEARRNLLAEVDLANHRDDAKRGADRVPGSGV